jgi:hypothetical protein
MYVERASAKSTRLLALARDRRVADRFRGFGAQADQRTGESVSR